jgi:3-oxoacyl-[acyl-carrier protein] reductase
MYDYEKDDVLKDSVTSPKGSENNKILSMDSESKVAVVTGSSRGIGAAIAKALAENGYNVILNYNKSKNLAEEIADDYDNVVTFKADVSKVSEVKKLINFAIDNFGKIDLLVNNAGVDLYKSINETTLEEFDNVMKTNLYSAYFASSYASDFMIKEKQGNIINISSIWGQIGGSMETAYSVSKAGLDGLTKSLAKELGPSNIRVNSIAPGIIDTSMNNFLNETELSEIENDIPLERIGTPEDVANTVLMLEKCDYITGQVIAVNGGWNI